MTNALALSDDQASAYDTLVEVLWQAGVDLVNEVLLPPNDKGGGVLAVLGRAGSGKTALLAEIVRALGTS